MGIPIADFSIERRQAYFEPFAGRGWFAAGHPALQQQGAVDGLTGIGWDMIGIPWNNYFSFLPPNKAPIFFTRRRMGKRGFTHVWDILGPFRGVWDWGPGGMGSVSSCFMPFHSAIVLPLIRNHHRNIMASYTQSWPGWWRPFNITMPYLISSHHGIASGRKNVCFGASWSQAWVAEKSAWVAQLPCFWL